MKINWSDNNSITILDRARPEMIDLEPFPHLVIKEALPISYYKALYNEFPNKDLYVDENNIGSNKYFWFKSIDLLNEPSIPKIWRNFARVHTSNAFFQKIVLLFGNTIKLAYPHVFNQKSLNEIRTSVRGSNLSSDLELDCQPTYCSPVCKSHQFQEKLI
ncbi:MAG: hypothetical protein IPI11_16240 [Haliscomenobacter sp.]|nr:hypothetical protein [Haliscomenobacter sp.]